MIYLDSSAVVKMIRPEVESRDLVAWLNARDEALEQLLSRAKKVSDTLAQRSGQVNQLITDGNSSAIRR